MDKLKTCIGSLRVLTRRKDPNTQVSVERLINEFLREEVGTLSASLERIGKAIDAEVIKVSWAKIGASCGIMFNGVVKSCPLNDGSKTNRRCRNEMMPLRKATY